MALTTSLSSCNEDGLADVQNNFTFAKRLSTYEIFFGPPADLNPSAEFHVYELNTELFSDYAMKQRLMKIPEGKQIIANADILPEFPDSTVLVKTFFYLNDFRDDSKGRRIIETRLLVKQGDRWNVATYFWNESQTDAMLVDSGLTTTVNWINSGGEPMITSYHVPSTRECVTCHSHDDHVVPIGPKIRNLHRRFNYGGVEKSQLAHWEDIGLMTRSGVPTDTLANWEDEKQPLNQRARSYLDVNCGHCHQPGGFGSHSKLYLDYDHGSESAIERRAGRIVDQMRRGAMPLIGTTLVHEEGLKLIEEYVKNLK